MTSGDRTNSLFTEVDANRDGKIDRNELRSWLTGGNRRTPSSYDASGVTSPHFDYDRDSVIHTNNAEETNRYLSTAHDIYRDSNPRIIRRTAGTENGLTYEQRISVRYLQPPTPPPPEPLLIKEVRPPQPPPPPPLVIREQPQGATQQAPLILRERPPPIPPRLHGETKTKVLEPIPVPPRSVIIERFQSTAPRPRDILIERWLPYGHGVERQVVVEPAPPPMRYPEPTHTIIVHDGGDARVNRKFENLGITREDPQSYVSRYGSSLLDSQSLIREARSAGVVEDLTPPHGTTFPATIHPREYGSNVQYTSDPARQTYASSGGLTTGLSSGYIASETGRASTGRWKEDEARDTEFTQYV